MMQFKTIDEVMQAVEKGSKVYWHNTSYQVLKEIDHKGNAYLRVTCLSNWFGSKLDASELGALFTN
jgi:hypothetical protein